MFLFSLLQSQAPSTQDSDKHFSHSVRTSAPPALIWKIWTDVPNWKDWDSGLQDAGMKEAFALKAKGKITSLEGRKSGFKVVEFTEGQSYTFKTVLPLGALFVKRTLSVEGTETVFTHEVWFSGLTGGIFARQFGPKFREMLPGVMQKIKKIAESMSTNTQSSQ